MLSRVIAFLAVLSFAVVTAMVVSHAAGLGFAGHYAAQSDHISAAESSHCDAVVCASDDAAGCLAVCAGMAAWMAPTTDAVVLRRTAVGPVATPVKVLRGNAPGPGERPPRMYLS